MSDWRYLVLVLSEFCIGLLLGYLVYSIAMERHKKLVKNREAGHG